MSNCFLHASSCPSFRTFRDLYFTNVMQAVAGVNDFSTLTIERLTAHVKAEHEALKQGMQKIVMDHYEEGDRN